MVLDTHRVEGGGVDGLVDLVRTSDRVRGEEGDDLERRETAGIFETLEDRGDAVLRLGDQADDGRDGLVGATRQELDLRGTLMEYE